MRGLVIGVTTACLLTISAGTAQAGENDPEVDYSHADYFSKRYPVRFAGYEEGWSVLDSDVASWRITSKGHLVVKRQLPATKDLVVQLAPGRYKVTSVDRYVYRSQASFWRVWETVGGCSLQPQAWLPDEDYGVVMGWTVTYRISCSNDEATYLGVGQSYVYEKQIGWEDVSDYLPMKWAGGDRSFAIADRATFRVRRRNPGWPSQHEYKALKIGMTPRQVARIVGSGGSQQSEGDGYQVRNYSDAMYLIFVRGRLNSKQWVGYH